jgi:hypothetical protein
VADIDLLVKNSVNASMRRAIPASKLLACLGGTADCEPWKEHLRALFEEVPREALFRFVLAHGISPRTLRQQYRALFSAKERQHGDLDAWLDELANSA